MPVENLNEICVYNSRYRHGVDEKRRVQIPSKWRPSKPGTEFTLIVWPKHKAGVCLRVLPPTEMSKLMLELDAMSADKRGSLKRQIGSQSTQVTLDSAGRITIPQDLADAASIKAEDEVVMVGLLDKFEIWNPKTHEAVKVADEVLSAQAFELME
jgi:MraZ protein